MFIRAAQHCVVVVVVVATDCAHSRTQRIYENLATYSVHGVCRAEIGKTTENVYIKENCFVARVKRLPRAECIAGGRRRIVRDRQAGRV